MALFIAFAAAMVVVALALLLLPLRTGNDPAAKQRALLRQAHAGGVLTEAEYQAKLAALPTAAAPAPGAPRGWILALAFCVPLLVVVLYMSIGEPAGLDPSAAAPPPHSGAVGSDNQAMEEATRGLAERLAQQPDDLAGWLLLTRAYKVMQKYDEALAALASAGARWPDDPDILIERAGLLVLRDPEQRITSEVEQLADRVLKAVPGNTQAHWLKGMAAYQAGVFADAVAHWQPVLDALPADSEGRAELLSQIADARERAGMPAAAAETIAAAPVTAANGAAPRLRVRIEIDPAMKARLQPSDVLFVSARASSGPRIPLAARRLNPADLPIDLELSDADAMAPQFRLSTASEVVVSARVSHAGVADPAPGDFEALPHTTATTASEPFTLRIDRERE